jgi:hypothetical protein
MYGQNETTYRDWTAQQWASEAPVADQDAMPHWTKDEWVGDQGQGLSGHLNAARMPEGEKGLSGFRHNSAAARWAPSH